MAIQVLHEIPLIRVTAGTPMLPHDLSKLFDDRVKLTAQSALPAGLELTPEGILRGMPPAESVALTPYRISMVASNESGARFEFLLELLVLPALGIEEIRTRKAKIWEQLAKFGEIRQIPTDILTRPVSPEEIAYLLQRYAYFVVWNAEDLRLADQGKIVALPDLNEHYVAYDFDVCLLISPKELFSSYRVISHGDQAARVIIQEAHRRQWQVEFGGHARMARIAWFEAQRLNQEGAHLMSIKNYQPPETQPKKPQKTANS